MINYLKQEYMTQMTKKKIIVTLLALFIFVVKAVYGVRAVLFPEELEDVDTVIFLITLVLDYGVVSFCFWYFTMKKTE